MSKIHFQIVPPIDRSDEPVHILGSLPELGAWQPERALCLRWKAPFHIGEVEAEMDTHFEYKILRGGAWEAEATDAYGAISGNLEHQVWLDATLHHTVADWKDRYTGRLYRERIHSRTLAGWRDLLVWLPPSYSQESTRRFPVVILHDGANVFDPLTSPLSGVDWAADEWVRLLSHQGVMPEAIVVGVCHPEGFSETNESLRDFDLSPELGGAAYAQFICRELIEHLDTHYRTLRDPSARVLAGASLGGLISFYIAIHHPGIFGNFACLSTAFEDMSQSLPANSGQLLALEAEPALPKDARIYFDYGAHGLDECYEPYHTELATLLREKGWKDGQQFTIACVKDGRHDELSWRQRFGDALRFLAK